MYTIGQVSVMFGLPVSTLRYYDKEGLFPHMQRSSGIRQFTDSELASLRIIECLKKSGMEIKDIKQFMEWTTQGSKTYPQRLAMFERQRKAVEAEMDRLNEVLETLDYKCWYYQQAMADGSEDRLRTMTPEEMPEDIRQAYFLVHPEADPAQQDEKHTA